jgi:hypothetical protein
MASGKTHPHIDGPSEADLGRLIEGRPSAIRELYLDAHRLVIGAVPDLEYSVDCHDAEIGYGARQFGYDGWGMAAITPYQKWVSLAFVRATSLDDPEGLLEGTGSTMRHIKLRSREELAKRREAIRRLLEEAVRVNQG